MRNKITVANILLLLLILLPLAVVFYPIVLGPLTWGDAPFFYNIGLKELIAEPSAWVTRGINFGGVNRFQWLSFYMLLYGALGYIGKLGNDNTIKLLFYLPSIGLSLIGPILLAKYLKFSKIVMFFAAIFYVFNTYYLLLIDGGVVGVALAYGFFPITLLCLLKLKDQPSYINFWVGLVASFLLTMFDPRISTICMVTITLWLILESVASRNWEKLANLKYLLIISVCLIPLSSYWLVPLFKLSATDISLTVSGLYQNSFLNSLFIFQPHYPQNIFGQTAFPPFYYAVLPLLVLLPTFTKNSKKVLVLTALFLFFAFLAKGEAAPLGGFYAFVVNRIPFGFAFRDSTKFFTPMTLLAGILIGNTVEMIIHFVKKIKKGKWSAVIITAVFAYLMFLVYPSMSGKMNFVLSQRNMRATYQSISEKINGDDGFFRTAWFPEKHPLALVSNQHPALDARDLVNLRPLARLNGGTYDKFNYLHNSRSLEWFKLFGIKYLFLSGDPRRVTLGDEETQNWNGLIDRIDQNPLLKKENWEVDVPAYSLADTLPHIYSLNKIVTVVGSDDIYDQVSNFQKVGFVFYEDGKFDPRVMEGTGNKSAVVVFNNKEMKDLIFSFLQKFFVGTAAANTNEWAYYKPTDYLLYKYQLEMRDLKYNDFDYDKGLSFSTQAGEKISFTLDIPEDGNYILAFRTMQSNGAQGIDFIFQDQQKTYLPKSGTFGWLDQKVNLKKGKRTVTLVNKSGLVVINTLALVPEEDWVKADALANIFINHFSVVKTKDVFKIAQSTNWQRVEYVKTSTNTLRLENLGEDNWIVFSDSYNSLWKLVMRSLESRSIPLYSAVNIFYKNPGWQEAEIIFTGQKEVRWGIYSSTVSILILGIIFLWFLPRKKEDN